MKTRNERHINPFELKNIEKQYIENYSKLANFNRKGYHAMFLDHIDLDDDFLEMMDMYSKLLKSNLAILCFSKKE
jgi:hypothetical protein